MYLPPVAPLPLRTFSPQSKGKVASAITPRTPGSSPTRDKIKKPKNKTYHIGLNPEICGKSRCWARPTCPGDELDIAMDSQAYLDNIQHAKTTPVSTYKYKKFGTARPRATVGPRPDLAETTVARTPRCSAATAHDEPHGIVGVCAPTAKTLRAASACDVAIASSRPERTAMPPRHVRNRRCERDR